MKVSSPPTGRPERNAPEGPEAITTGTEGSLDASLAVMPPRTISTPLKTGAVTSDLPRRADLKERFYHPELDSIRFFLFCAILAFHAFPPYLGKWYYDHLPAAMAFSVITIGRACAPSLDVFFVISAYLITELILREREKNGSVDLKAFYVRRLLRIWPLYFFFIGLLCLLSLFDKSLAVGWARILAFLLFAGNWAIAFGRPSIIIGPLWSVSVEEQFYLLWPLVLRMASRRIILAVPIGLLALASFARLMLLRVPVFVLCIWCNTLAHMDSIACGILLAVILHGRKLRLRLRTRFVLLGSGLITWVLIGRYCGLIDLIPPLAGNMLGYPLMSLGAVAIFLSVLGASQDGAPVMKSPVLVYLGKISYGLYVFHMLVVELIGRLLLKHIGYFGLKYLVARWICAFAATLVLAVISFHCLEKPFLRLKRRFTYVPSGAAI
ncbi:MAG: hypothetical protein DMG23_00610 [Acidobacteria bacterium]|nr:MAG: hypothetical protein DMG23_00610 [Acidobacteriota bacterium]